MMRTFTYFVTCETNVLQFWSIDYQSKTEGSGLVCVCWKRNPSAMHSTVERHQKLQIFLVQYKNMVPSCSMAASLECPQYMSVSWMPTETTRRCMWGMLKAVCTAGAWLTSLAVSWPTTGWRMRVGTAVWPATSSSPTLRGGITVATVDSSSAPGRWP